MSVNFYPRSPCGERLPLVCMTDGVTGISIHALLAESDRRSSKTERRFPYFYPRSPCGERHLPCLSSWDWLTNFYPRSPCGERRQLACAVYDKPDISIHALLAESDNTACSKIIPLSNFYPRSPCGERRFIVIRFYSSETISIHALLAESDGYTVRTCKSQ